MLVASLPARPGSPEDSASAFIGRSAQRLGRDVGLHLAQDVGRLGSLQALDVVLVLQQHAERIDDEGGIEGDSVEFDQGRLSIIQALAGAEVAPEIAMLKSRMQKFDDIAPLLEAQARRREATAVAMEGEGNLASAAENYFIASHYWATAQ